MGGSEGGVTVSSTGMYNGPSDNSELEERRAGSSSGFAVGIDQRDEGL